MNKSIKVLFGLFISALCLWFTFRNFKLDSLEESFSQASWFWALPCLLIYMSGHLMRSLRWAIILSPLKIIKPLKLFSILLFGFFINNILPLRAGELARAYALKREEDISLGAILGSVAAERLSDMFGIIFFGTLAILFYQPLQSKIFHLLLLFLVGVAILFCSLWAGKKLIPRLQNSSHLFINKLMLFFDQIIHGFSSLKSPQKIIQVLGASVVIWFIEGFTLYLMGSKVFHLDLSYIQAIIIDLGLCLGVMIPSSPGYVGTFEFFGKETMKKLGFALTPSLSFLLVLHFFYAFSSSLVGLPYLLKFGLKGLTRNQKEPHALSLHI